MKWPVVLIVAAAIFAAFQSNSEAQNGPSGGPKRARSASQAGKTYDAQALTPAQQQRDRALNQGQNLPYPDRRYGDPGRW